MDWTGLDELKMHVVDNHCSWRCIPRLYEKDAFYANLALIVPSWQSLPEAGQEKPVLLRTSSLVQEDGAWLVASLFPEKGCSEHFRQLVGHRLALLWTVSLSMCGFFDWQIEYRDQRLVLIPQTTDIVRKSIVFPLVIVPERLVECKQLPMAARTSHVTPDLLIPLLHAFWPAFDYDGEMLLGEPTDAAERSKIKEMWSGASLSAIESVTNHLHMGDFLPEECDPAVYAFTARVMTNAWNVALKLQFPALSVCVAHSPPDEVDPQITFYVSRIDARASVARPS